LKGWSKGSKKRPERGNILRQQLQWTKHPYAGDHNMHG